MYNANLFFLVFSEPVPLYGGVQGNPFRITLCVSDGEVALVQACVETSLEWVTEARLESHLPSGTRIVQIFAADWLFPEELLTSVLTPVLPCSHLHRHARGSDLVAGKYVKLSSWTSAYPAVFCAAFAQCWLVALSQKFTGAFSYAFDGFDTELSLHPREVFEVPDAPGGVCSVCQVEPGSPAFYEAVADGRKIERSEVAAHEPFAQQVRDDDAAAGEVVPSLNASLRSLLTGDQWKGRECAEACSALLHHSAADDDAAPGSRRLASDFCLEERVCQPCGECSWMPVLLATGSPGAGQSWQRFLFLHVHAGPFGGHRTCKGTTFCHRRLATFRDLERRIEAWCKALWV